MDDKFRLTINNLQKLMRATPEGREYWTARSIQPTLGYTRWESFEEAIERAREACEASGVNAKYHFREFPKMIETGKGAQRSVKDYYLSRYACYLTAMNGEPNKPEIGAAQTYFAWQTRRQELHDGLTADEKRIQLRDRVRHRNRSLVQAAKKSGVSRFSVFHAAGYRGLYQHTLAEILRMKGIPPGHYLLDHAGRAELAANEFRITQTESKLERDKVNTEPLAIDTHFQVASEVRSAIDRVGGVMPEDLPAEPHIKVIEKKVKARRRQLTGPKK